VLLATPMQGTTSSERLATLALSRTTKGNHAA
jgi:hypothetical protein